MIHPFWAEDLKQALDELQRHRTRTALTLLGMVFGVAAVVAMVSVGEGAQREALALIEAMGLRNIIIDGRDMSQDARREIREESHGLTLQDLNAIRMTLPFLENVTAAKQVQSYSLFSQWARTQGTVMGVLPSYFGLFNLSPGQGRLLCSTDQELGHKVCVLGHRIARELFGSRSPLLQPVKVNHIWLTVVGVLEPRNPQRESFQGVKLDSPDNRIYLPIHTAHSWFRFKPLEDELDRIVVRVADTLPSSRAAATVDTLIATRHGRADDYELVVPEALLRQQQQTQRIFNIVMASIAGISLLVGGIGIMNIMLASVLERTREIGIRRAIGARRADIIRLFMLEALSISLVGGLLGIATGFALARLIAFYSQWSIAWSSESVLLAFGVCSITGLVFGIFPAIKASRLNPIEALRHD